jgi:hypothetical protein
MGGSSTRIDAPHSTPERVAMETVPLGDVSAAFMFVTALLCFLGLLSSHFKDNLFQTVAMGCGMIGCGSRCVDLWGRIDIPLDWFLIHACMGLFSIGVAWKVLKGVYGDRVTLVVRRMHIDWPQHGPKLAAMSQHEDQ